MEDQTRTEIEAAAFRRLQRHLLEDRPDVQNIDLMNMAGAVVAELTLIPSLDVSADNLKARFGVPDSARPVADGTLVEYRYATAGLRAILGKDALPMLHFANPSAAKQASE